MQPLDVYVDDKQQRGFRRRALHAFHNNQEYLEAMFIRRGLGEFHVERFIPVKILQANRYGVLFDSAEYEKLKADAKAAGLEFGTIHTHILNDSAPSKVDHTEGVSEGETLIGVCEIERSKSGRAKVVSLDFWQPQLPAKLHVVRSKK